MAAVACSKRLAKRTSAQPSTKKLKGSKTNAISKNGKPACPGKLNVSAVSVLRRGCPLDFGVACHQRSGLYPTFIRRAVHVANECTFRDFCHWHLHGIVKHHCRESRARRVFRPDGVPLFGGSLPLHLPPRGNLVEKSTARHLAF